MGVFEEIQHASHPLRAASDLDPLIARIGESRVVLLGEASHGTHDYYEWRARLTKRLILEKGFNFVAVEGDWPACYQINRFVKDHRGAGTDPHAALRVFDRWPTWMWANEETASFVSWLRARNDTLPQTRAVGFYGLDVYSLWESIESLGQQAETLSPAARQALAHVTRCFSPYQGDARDYARATVYVSESCEAEAVALLRELHRKHGEFDEDGDAEAHFQAEQNAHVLKNAEAYYRTMVRGGPESWNLRDTHMMDTLDRLLAHHGNETKAIVWEHNTHVGDARFTDMTREGLINVGQLARERHGEAAVVIVGFGSYAGTVVAAREWDARTELMPLPPAQPGSFEALLHAAGPVDRLLVFSEQCKRGDLAEERPHRAVGVVYHPELERYGNYVPTVVPRRYDAFLYIDQSSGLHPLPVKPEHRHEPPDTYPSAQ